MLEAVQVTIGDDGRVEFDEPVRLAGRRRAILTFIDSLDEAGARDARGAGETGLMSEASLAVDWDTPGEDEAWAHLQDLPVDPSLQQDDTPESDQGKGP